jgi:hypothetical protein
MPGITQWIRLYLLAASSMFALLMATDLLRGRTVADSWVEQLAWSVTSAAIFIGARYQKVRKGVACGVCDVVTKK